MTYTYDNIKDAVNARLHNKIGVISSVRDSINIAVKYVWNDVNLRTAKRKSALSPVLDTDTTSYTLPTDIKGDNIVDLVPQDTDTVKPAWSIVSKEEFERSRLNGDNLIALDPTATTYKLLISTLFNNSGTEAWDLIYYTKYPWQSATGTYQQDSILDADYINADSDEYNLVIEKCVEMLGYGAREYDDAMIAKRNYSELLEQYKIHYPSENILMTSTYYEFDSSL